MKVRKLISKFKKTLKIICTLLSFIKLILAAPFAFLFNIICQIGGIIFLNKVKYPLTNRKSDPWKEN
jgi:hypothetical protein